MPPTPKTRKKPLLSETPPLLSETEESFPLPLLNSETNQTMLLSETNPTTSESKGDGLNQKVYIGKSHGRRYFRYVCSVGHKIAIQQTIPGGCIDNRIAQARAAEVERWIYHNVDPKEIERRIKAWPRRGG
jgi:hypothetical protein